MLRGVPAGRRANIAFVILYSMFIIRYSS